MTTTIYREFEFAACDSKWSVDGHLRRDVIEKKAIHIDFKGKEAISLMCGDHPIIVLMQAMQLKVITPEQYASLTSLYMDVEDFTFGMVVLDKHSGAILVGMYTPPMIAIKSKQIVYDLGSTGGEFAAHCLYYAERLRKKSVIVDTLHRQWDVRLPALSNMHTDEIATPVVKYTKSFGNNASCTTTYRYLTTR